MLDNKLNASLSHFTNNYDFIRLSAACLVIVSHSYDLLYGTQAAEKLEPLRFITNQQMSFGSLGVWIFFCASGYLITQSLERSTSYQSYLLKRALRIFPALVLELIIAVFIWGALVTVLPLPGYFSNPQTYNYLTNVFLYQIT